MMFERNADSTEEVLRGDLTDGAQLYEFAVFLGLIVPSMLFSFFAVKTGSVSFVLTAWATLARDLSLIGLVLFFLWRNGEPVTRIGWTLRRPIKEIALGMALFIPFYFAMVLLETGFKDAGLSGAAQKLPSFLTARGAAQMLLALLLVVVVAFAEETIFRGYLILRLRSLTGSRILAVLASSFIFALGHGYEGTAGVMTVGTMGMVFALVYLWRGSLVAAMVMHFLQDFTGILLLPLLFGH
jgi:membrane protease YdiL (CAAX protease family)